jgi:opacity protein-like surface antigen
MKSWLVLSTVACLALAGTAFAEVRMGDSEVTFSGSFFNQNAGTHSGLDWTSWMVTGSLGYFLTDNIEVAGVGLFQDAKEKWNDGETRMLDRTSHLYAGGAQVKYHFTPENMLVPYIGAQIQWADLKVKEDWKDSATPGEAGQPGSWERDKQGILWGPLAGLRYTLNEKNEVFVEYQYHIYTESIGDYLDDGNVILVGLAHKFN